MNFAFLLSVLFMLTGSAESDSKTVYICVSPNATSYHYSKSCQGIKRCTHEIKEVSIEKAVNEYGRKLCGYED